MHISQICVRNCVRTCITPIYIHVCKCVYMYVNVGVCVYVYIHIMLGGIYTL